MEHRFHYCKHCGNLVGMINDSGVPIICCGEPMTELIANTSDGAAEKHVPIIEKSGSKILVTVGNVEHPMLAEHSIQWVYLKTKKGGQRKNLETGDAPVAQFCVADDDKAVSAYAYCNQHGLWKSDVNA